MSGRKPIVAAEKTLEGVILAIRRRARAPKTQINSFQRNVRHIFRCASQKFVSGIKNAGGNIQQSCSKRRTQTKYVVYIFIYIRLYRQLPTERFSKGRAQEIFVSYVSNTNQYFCKRFLKRVGIIPFWYLFGSILASEILPLYNRICKAPTEQPQTPPSTELHFTIPPH